ncbi:hypothetical protein [Kingella potus]|uniref:hypothetical protein n=1 Tax=Kingella potus TaxID=265175 RepID=UPI0011C04B91|nr:hypothetical protein [Kingella potus]UOP00117.1 hypothetical protein LVJ84_09130 [Kingella potus]
MRSAHFRRPPCKNRRRELGASGKTAIIRPAFSDGLRHDKGRLNAQLRHSPSRCAVRIHLKKP